MAAEHQTGIYEIRNVVNGKRYVGSAMDFAKRWREHINALQRSAHHCLPLQRAWCLYGPGAFHFNKLIACTKDNLIMYEQAAMDALAPEYNVAPRAGSQLGYRHSEASRRRMSESRRKDFSPFTGRSHSKETRAKISASRKGKGGGAYEPGRVKSAADAMRAAKSVLSPEAVARGRRLRQEGATIQKVADLAGCSFHAAYDFLRGRTFSWVK
ncbi:NUMOD3 domain-containing DNA-binding protein [Pseudorhodoferax sp. LjRoot39]|uniref:NUMOD3 domain-containing DNA-binding protein n=1 Tax=Pseudorhodoferax sp. LjRoot39 TaxID=3342328 RepID=UPI003ECC2F70